MAKRLEGKPFHLVATHCQNGARKDVVDYIKSKGLSADTANMTVSSFGGHPKVEGNGYVPYYMVFDHHGELVHHHMCGDYHGGDGLKMIEIVDRLLSNVPAVYLGKEPFTELSKLAKQVGKLQKLPAALREIEKRSAADPAPSAGERAELERLRSAIDDYRTRMLGQVDDLLVRDPSAVLSHLRSLHKQFSGTPAGEEILARVKELSVSKDLATAVKLHKAYAKTMKRLAKGEPTAKLKRAAVKKLEKLIENHGGLPFAATIRAAIEDLR